MRKYSLKAQTCVATVIGNDWASVPIYPGVPNCELCKDFYTKTAMRIYSAELTSRKRRRDCPVCAMIERVLKEFIPSTSVDHPFAAEGYSTSCTFYAAQYDETLPLLELAYFDERLHESVVKVMLYSSGRASASALLPCNVCLLM